MLKRIGLSLILTGCLSQVALSAAPTARPKAPQSASSPLIDSIYFNFGNHTEFYNAVQVDDTGQMRKFQWAPTIGLGLNIPLAYSWRFIPEFNWVLPFSDSSNNKVMKNLFMFRADFGYDVLEWFRLRVGTSLMVLNQHGKGGTAQIDNGNSTSTFYYPDENHTSFNNTFDLGTEFIYEDWSARFQAYTYSLFKAERRQVSYSLFLTYKWDI